jgi:predicted transcriptional regulator
MTTKRRTIIRAAHNEQPYFMMLRSVAQVTTLSYEALGLLAYLLSKPNDWEVYPDTLKRKGTGRASVYKLLKELREAGHVQRVVLRDEKKKIARFEYVVYEYPLPEAERDLLPTMQEVALQDMAKQDVGNQHNTEYRLSESKERERTAAPGADDDGIPDHVPPASRSAMELTPQPDGGAKVYTLIEAYCDAWDVAIQKYRDQWHRSEKRGAEKLANLGAMPDEVRAMIAERRAKGKQPDECPMAYLANDYVGWKSRQKPVALTVLVMTDEQRAAREKQLETERIEHRIREGLA